MHVLCSLVLITASVLFSCSNPFWPDKAERKNPPDATVYTVTASNFTFDNAARTYNGAGQPITVNYDGAGINITTAGTITVYYDDSTAAPKNVGTYDIKVTTANGSTYAPVENPLKIGSVTITPLPLTISDPVIAAKTYNGDNIADVTMGSLTNIISGDDVSASISSAAYNSADVATANLITVIYSIAGSDAGNYLKPADYSTPSTITQAAGAPVSQKPHESAVGNRAITVEAVTIADTGQSIEYAISTVSDGTGPLIWQNSTTFNGLEPNTGYYVYARYASNGNYHAGTAQVSAMITTLPDSGGDIPGYAITIDPIADYSPELADGISGIILSRSSGNTVTITLKDPEQYSGFEWYYNNELLSDEETLTLSAADIRYNMTGLKLITVEAVTYDNIRYSQTITFTVEQ